MRTVQSIILRVIVIKYIPEWKCSNKAILWQSLNLPRFYYWILPTETARLEKFIELLYFVKFADFETKNLTDYSTAKKHYSYYLNIENNRELLLLVIALRNISEYNMYKNTTIVIVN